MNSKTRLINLDFMQDVFQKSIELRLEDAQTFSLDSRFEEVKGWDSLGHMRIVLELEIRLDVEFDLDEIIGVDTIKQLISMCNKKLSE